MRVGEVAGLRVGDVEIRAEGVVLYVTGKGGKRRVVGFEGRNGGALRAWARVRGEAGSDEAWLLAGTVVGDPVPPLTVASLDYIVRRAARAAGLAAVHAHLLRHTAASLALRGGANLVEVRDLLGHASIVTTSRYLHARAELRLG